MVIEWEEKRECKGEYVADGREGKKELKEEGDGARVRGRWGWRERE